MYDFYYNKRNFFNTAVADIYRALDGGALTGAFTLTFCLIDYLTWLEFGKNGDKKYFSKWVEKRLRPISSRYTKIGEELWSVRCGLVHTYGPSIEMLKEKYEGYDLSSHGVHLTRINNRKLKISLYELLTDMVYATYLIFDELEKNKPKKVLDRLSKQIKNLDEDPPLHFKDMHRALSVLDNPGAIHLYQIKGEYTNKILFPEEINECWEQNCIHSSRF